MVPRGRLQYTDHKCIATTVVMAQPTNKNKNKSNNCCTPQKSAHIIPTVGGVAHGSALFNTRSHRPSNTPSFSLAPVPSTTTQAFSSHANLAPCGSLIHTVRTWRARGKGHATSVYSRMLAIGRNTNQSTGCPGGFQAYRSWRMRISQADTHPY